MEDNAIHTKEKLKELQELPLERKIMITQAKIIEWYQKNNGQVYISFSGGKDSTVLLDIARKCFPDIEAVFCDTGLEYPEIKDFVKTFDNVAIVRPKMSFRKVIEKYGYPIVSKEISNVIYYAKKGSKWAKDKLDGSYKNKQGEISLFQVSPKWKCLLDAPFNVSNNCCAVMKKKPLKSYSKLTKKVPIIATMADESSQRKSSWLRTGCNVFDSKNPQSKPISFWTEQDVLNYIKEYNIPIVSVYGDIVKENGKLKTTGCNRTGCIFCGFGCHLEKEPNRFQLLKQTHPQLYDYCMKPWDKGGLGMDNVLSYINVKH